MTTPVESSNVSMGTLVGQSHMSQVSDRPLSTMVNFIKPGVSSATNSQVLVVRKNSGISSFVQAPTFSRNQLITTRSDGPKIVNVPMASVQNSTKITSLDGTTQFAIAKNAGVKVVWPSNLTPGLLPVKQIAPNSNSKNAQPIAIKRTVAPSLGNQVITKVIITNNSSNQSVTPVSVSANVSGTGSALHTQQSLLSSPSKTITLSRNLMNIAGTQQMVKTTTTPANKGVYLLSPVKPLPKIATVPSSLMKSPRRIAPATSTFSSLVTSSKLSTVAGSIGTTTPAITKTITVPQSPKKILLKTVGGNLASVLASTPVTPSQMQSTGMGGQHMQIPGNNVHFVRLVSAPSSSTTNTTIANKQTTLMSNTTTTTTVPSLPTITVTSQMCKTAALAKQALKIKPAQKLLIPAPTSSSHGGTSGTLTNTQIGQLASGTLIPIVGSGQGYVVVPANYMSQTQQASQSSQNAPVVIQNILPAPVISTSGGTASSISSGIETSANTSANFLLSSAANQVISHHVSKYMNGRMPTETADSRPRKPCNCTKSQCLKLYCDCFASGEFCNGCNCNNCYNNLQHEEERQKAIKSCLDRNRMAFHPKIGKSREGDTERRHTKGCHCKRSGCLKNYCECYEAKILCTDLCKCIGCKNFEDSYERKTLMHLADAAEVRVQQQAAAITNFTADIFEGLPRPQFNLNRGAPLPISFVNEEVIEATVACLLARAHQAEKQRKSAEETEKALVEEFGLCLMSIISRSKQQQEMCSDADSNS